MEGNIFYFGGWKSVGEVLITSPIALKPGSTVSLYYNL